MWNPRVGGEKAATSAASKSNPGSPPHGRGKEDRLVNPRLCIGITPAWAGKRLSEKTPAAAPWDHPRVGGEKWFIALLFEPCEGSPPRRRGKVVHCAAVRALRGITPRVGGEKIIWASVSIAALESPPHGRGKGVVEGGHVEVNRITPAWAGKSLVTPSIPQTRGDHPRVGGEKTVTEKGETQRTGSPPRRRGKDRRLVVDVLPEGITPAWAGKSLASQPWSPPLWMMVIRPRP